MKKPSLVLPASGQAVQKEKSRLGLSPAFLQKLRCRLKRVVKRHQATTTGE